MDINFNAIVNMMMLAEIRKESPTYAKIFDIFAKRGISVADTMAILLELLTVADEIEKSGGEQADSENGKSD